MKLKLAAGTAVVAVAVPAAVALAAPARNGAVSTAAPVFKWDGGPISGAAATQDVSDVAGYCTPSLNECDDTLLKADSAGQILIKSTDPDDTTVDLDMYVYESDASGKEGKLLKSSAGATPEEAATVEAEPGSYYLVRLMAAAAVAGTYKGTATLTPAEGASEPAPGGEAPAAPAPSGEQNAAPTTKITKVSKSAISGTASDDRGVARVQVAVVQVKGSKCYGLQANGSFKKLAKCSAPSFLQAKGTSSWILKPKKALKKGKYVAYARAIDSSGVAEGGFGSANKRSFSVK